MGGAGAISPARKLGPTVSRLQDPVLPDDGVSVAQVHALGVTRHGSRLPRPGDSVIVRLRLGSDPRLGLALSASPLCSRSSSGHGPAAYRSTVTVIDHQLDLARPRPRHQCCLSEPDRAPFPNSGHPTRRAGPSGTRDAGVNRDMDPIDERRWPRETPHRGEFSIHDQLHSSAQASGSRLGCPSRTPIWGKGYALKSHDDAA